MNGNGITYIQDLPSPSQLPPKRLDSFRKYLEDSDSDSDSSSDSDSESDSDNGESGTWQHIYGLSTIFLILICIFYLYKIRREFNGMYEGGI